MKKLILTLSLFISGCTVVPYSPTVTVRTPIGGAYINPIPHQIYQPPVQYVIPVYPHRHHHHHYFYDY